VGDSIAVGVGQFRPDCETVARVGITSERYIAELLPLVAEPADAAVISLGVNDDTTVPTLDNLRIVRARFPGKTVYWLLPGLKDTVRAMIRTVAAENGDRLIDTRPEAGPDHLHPTGQGYRFLASRIDAGADEYAALPPLAAPEPEAHTSYGMLTPAQRIRRLRALRRRQGPIGYAQTGHGHRGHALILRSGHYSAHLATSAARQHAVSHVALHASAHRPAAARLAAHRAPEHRITEHRPTDHQRVADNARHCPGPSHGCHTARPKPG
jgi:hypothetical protein